LGSDLIVGAPVLRIKDKKEDVFYSSVKPVKENSQDGAFTVEAMAYFQGKKGIKANVQTRYRFFPEEARIDITSTLTNTGKKEIEDLDYNIYFNALHSYSFRPFSGLEFQGLPEKRPLFMLD